MYLKETLYVRPNTKMSKMKGAISVQELEDIPYQVIDIWYSNDMVAYGVVNHNNQVVYMPYNCWLVLDSKTKKLLNEPKEVANV